MAAGPDRGAVTPITISVSVTPGARDWLFAREGRTATARARIATRTSTDFSAQKIKMVGQGAALHRRNLLGGTRHRDGRARALEKATRVWESLGRMPALGLL